MTMLDRFYLIRNAVRKGSSLFTMLDRFYLIHNAVRKALIDLQLQSSIVVKTNSLSKLAALCRLPK